MVSHTSIVPYIKVLQHIAVSYKVHAIFFSACEETGEQVIAARGCYIAIRVTKNFILSIFTFFWKIILSQKNVYCFWERIILILIDLCAGTTYISFMCLNILKHRCLLSFENLNECIQLQLMFPVRFGQVQNCPNWSGKVKICLKHLPKLVQMCYRICLNIT